MRPAEASVANRLFQQRRVALRLAEILIAVCKEDFENGFAVERMNDSEVFDSKTHHLSGPFAATSSGCAFSRH